MLAFVVMRAQANRPYMRKHKHLSLNGTVATNTNDSRQRRFSNGSKHIAELSVSQVLLIFITADQLILPNQTGCAWLTVLSVYTYVVKLPHDESTLSWIEHLAEQQTPLQYVHKYAIEEDAELAPMSSTSCFFNTPTELTIPELLEADEDDAPADILYDSLNFSVHVPVPDIDTPHAPHASRAAAGAAAGVALAEHRLNATSRAHITRYRHKHVRLPNSGAWVLDSIGEEK